MTFFLFSKFNVQIAVTCKMRLISERDYYESNQDRAREFAGDSLKDA